MPKTLKKRKSAASIRIDPNVRCDRIYPVDDNPNRKITITDRKTVGLKLSRPQAVHLARVLLAATQEWDEIEVTAWRRDKRKSDGTYHVTVTSAVAEN